MNGEKRLKLPSHNYGPYCLRILKEFCEYHKIDKSLSFPNAEDTIVNALSKIFDIILHSIPKEEQEKILKDLDQYVMSIPAVLR